jgi:hypothetical protein
MNDVFSSLIDMFLKEWLRNTYHKVVDDIVAGPLPEERHANNHGQSVSRSTGVHKLAEIPPWVVIVRGFGILDNLSILELHKRRVRIAIAVVLGKDSQSLLGLVVVDEPW